MAAANDMGRLYDLFPDAGRWRYMEGDKFVAKLYGLYFKIKSTPGSEETYDVETFQYQYPNPIEEHKFKYEEIRPYVDRMVALGFHP